MSDALTTTAPGDTPAVAPPAAPAATPEVPSGSTTSTEVVPAERFNGLMSSFNRLQTESDARIKALEDEANSLRTAQENIDVTPTEPTTPTVDPALAALVEQNQQLLAALAADRADKAKAAVLEKYPEAKPFAELLIGDDEASLEAVAAKLTEIVKPAAPASGETTPPAAPAATAPVVTPDAPPAAPVVPVIAPTVPAGGTVAPADGDATSRIVDIITKAADGGRGGGPEAWQAFLAAKADQTADAGNLA